MPCFDLWGNMRYWNHDGSLHFWDEMSWWDYAAEISKKKIPWPVKKIHDQKWESFSSHPLYAGVAKSLDPVWEIYIRLAGINISLTVTRVWKWWGGIWVTRPRNNVNIINSYTSFRTFSLQEFKYKLWREEETMMYKCFVVLPWVNLKMIPIDPVNSAW